MLLAEAQADLGHRVRIVYTEKSADGDIEKVKESVHLIHVKAFGPNRWCPSIQKIYSRNQFKFDIIHSHGLWLDISRQAGRLAEKSNTPHVLSPCGMLQRDALEISKFKKRLAWVLFQRRVLNNASVIHAKSLTEKEGILDLFPTASVRVLPNPLRPFPNGSFETFGKLTKSQLENNLNGEEIHPNIKVVLFLGRYHPAKGLKRLIHAWKKLNGHYPSWRLVMIGPDENGYRGEVELLIQESRVENTARVYGPLFGRDKWMALENADLFIMPSDFENFGQSIAEALSMGVPVITTTGTPWEELAEKGCGWWVEPSVESLATALHEAMSLSDEQRKTMGATGKDLVKKLHPIECAKRMCDLYEQLL